MTKVVTLLIVWLLMLAGCGGGSQCKKTSSLRDGSNMAQKSGGHNGQSGRACSGPEQK